jgi:hypothetical protein
VEEIISRILCCRYALITHSLLSYDLCQRVGQVHQEILSSLATGIDHVDQVDVNLAGKLIEEKLVPFLRQHNITPEACLYNSKYYDK